MANNILARRVMAAKNSSELTWKKPTGEETPTLHRECIYSRGELSQNKNIIKSHLSFQWRITITYYSSGREKLRGNQREHQEARSYKDWRGLARSLRHHGLVIPFLFFSL